jgi:hypothetical protein
VDEESKYVLAEARDYTQTEKSSDISSLEMGADPVRLANFGNQA